MPSNRLIIKDIKTCKLELEANPEIISKVRALLSYKQEGAEYSIAFKHGWNGMVCLLSKKNTFPAGLFSKVSNFLKSKEIPFEIVDKRIVHKMNVPMDISERLAKLEIIPRDYQLQAVEVATKHSPALLRLCTAAGKSILACLIMAKYNTSSIVYVPSIDLLDQFHGTMSSIFEEPIGRIGNGICEIHRLNVMTIQTAGRALGMDKDIFEDEELREKEDFNVENKKNIVELLETAGLHIIDECHSATNKTIRNICKQINPIQLIGMSGTPYRNVPSDILIEGLLGPQVINITVGELVKKGILAQPYIKFLNVPQKPVYARTYNEVYAEYIVENETRNNLIMEQTKHLLSKGYKPLILFRTLKHGDIIFDLIQKAGIKCVKISGKDSLEKRKEVKEKYNNGDIDCIISSSIFEVGIDLPKLNSYINASGQKSYVKVLQKMGRVIRGYPGKRSAAIVEFVDNCRYLKNHSDIRYNIYKSEDGLKISYPKENYWKK